MKDTQRIKGAISTVAGFAKKAEEALADKKVTFIEGITLGIAATKFGAVISQWPEIKAEYKDLTPSEHDEIVEHLANELDLTNDKAELAIEQAFVFLAQFNQLVTTLKAA